MQKVSKLIYMSVTYDSKTFKKIFNMLHIFKELGETVRCTLAFINIQVTSLPPESTVFYSLVI